MWCVGKSFLFFGERFDGGLRSGKILRDFCIENKEELDLGSQGGPRLASMEGEAHCFGFWNGKEAGYGSSDTFYVRLRGSEEDEQPLGSGQDDEERHYVYAMGLESCGE